MLKLVSNIDDGIVYLAKWLEDITREYPNPSNTKELELCDPDKKIVHIVRKDEEEAEHFKYIKDKAIPVSVIIHQKGEFETIPDTMSQYPQLDTKVINDIKFYGKETRYKSPIKISIISRSLFACKTLSFYLSELIRSKRVLKYPAFIYEDKNIVGHLTDYCSMRFILPSPMSFAEEALEEAYYRLSTEFHFIDSYLFFKDSDKEEEVKKYEITYTLRTVEDDNRNS